MFRCRFAKNFLEKRNDFGPPRAPADFRDAAARNAVRKSYEKRGARYLARAYPPQTSHR